MLAIAFFLYEAGEREESQTSDERTGSWIRVLFCTGFVHIIILGFAASIACNLDWAGQSVKGLTCGGDAWIGHCQTTGGKTYIPR